MSDDRAVTDRPATAAHTPAPWKWFDYPDGRKLLCGPDWAVIHCPDSPLTISAADARLVALSPDLLDALRVIYTAVRGDEKSECWTIRKWLDERDVFNDDIQGSERLIEEVCRHLMAKAEGR